MAALAEDVGARIGRIDRDDAVAVVLQIATDLVAVAGRGGGHADHRYRFAAREYGIDDVFIVDRWREMVPLIEERLLYCTVMRT